MITSRSILSMLAMIGAVLLASCSDSSRKAGEAFDSDVYVSGEQEYSYFRIPSLAMNDNFLYAFAEGRKHSLADHGEISIVLKRSSDHGMTWGNLITVVESAGGSAQNPTPVWIEDTRTLMLLFTRRTVGTDTEQMIRDGSSEGYMGVYKMESHNQGLSWTEPEEITEDVKKQDWNWYALGPGGAIIMQYHPEYRGRIIVPANHSLEGSSSNDLLGAHVIWSDDNGISWNLGAVDSQGESTVNPNETAVVELLNGDLYFNTRNHSGEDTVAHRAISISRDGGTNFESMFRHEPRLTTPIVHASLARNSSSVFFVAPSDWQSRVNLSLWISPDDTRTWNYDTLLHIGPSAYSSSCMTGPSTLGILFEADEYEKILYKSLPLKPVGD